MLPQLPFANITHLGWAVRDIDKTIKTFEALGLGDLAPQYPGGHEAWTAFEQRADGGGMEQRAKVALARWGAMVVELFEPINFPVVEKFLEPHGEGIWHFGYSVNAEQFDATIAEVQKQGIDVIGTSLRKNGVRMAFLASQQDGRRYVPVA